MIKLYDYQIELIDKIRAKKRAGVRKLIVQLSTGGGKTIIFSDITSSWINTTKNDVLIIVDRDRLFNNTRETLLKHYKIDSDIINPEQCYIKRGSLFGQNARVFVAMVETLHRRASMDTFLSQLDNVGLVIIDEAHMGNFNKILQHFPDSFILGFTATPESSNKKEPMCKYWEDIVVGPKTSFLVEHNKKHPNEAVVQDYNIRLKLGNIKQEVEDEQKTLGWKGQDYNEDIVGKKMSAPRQIVNTIEGYVKNTPGKKAFCFNPNIAHSKLVADEMRKYGLNAKHFDGSFSDKGRNKIYDWFEKESDAILCNVGMTTKGVDIPSAEVCMLNTLTKSRAKYNQMCGRVMRWYKYPSGIYKQVGIVLDFCDNIMGVPHGCWSDDYDWEHAFKNPKMPKQGVAPMKECPECGYICAASARKCPGKIENPFDPDGEWIDCGFEFDFSSPVIDEVERTFEILTKGIDVSAIINHPSFEGRSHFLTFFKVIQSCAYNFSKNCESLYMDKIDFEGLWESLVHPKIREWQVLKGGEIHPKGHKLRDNDWYKEKGREKLLSSLREYGFIVDL